MTWRTTSVFLPLCAAAFTFVVAEGETEASVLTCGATSCSQTESFDFTDVDTDRTSTGTSQTLTFELFNGALGTLDSVVLTLNSIVNISLTVEGFEGGSSDSSHSASVTSTQLGVTDEEIFSDGLIAFCDFGSCPDTDMASPGLTGNLFSLLSLPAPDPDDYDDGPGPFNIELVALALVGDCDSVGGDDPDCFADTNWTGNIRLDYNFTPTSSDLPEPATAGLLGFGLASIGYLSRRRRKGGSEAAS